MINHNNPKERILLLIYQGKGEYWVMPDLSLVEADKPKPAKSLGRLNKLLQAAYGPEDLTQDNWEYFLRFVKWGK